MCKIRILNHTQSGCNLIKLTITYCPLCPYVSKRPLSTSTSPTSPSSTTSSPSCTSPSSTESSDYQIYWFSHYLDLFFHKSNKKWKARLRKCPNWEGAKLVEVGEGEACPAGKMCQSDKDRRVRLLVRKTVEKKKDSKKDNKKDISGRLKLFLMKTSDKKQDKNSSREGNKETESDEEDLMDELARLERGYDVEVERVKVLCLERDRWMERVKRVVGEMEKVFESVADTLAGLEIVSRERSPSEKRKTWWSEEDVLLKEK